MLSSVTLNCQVTKIVMIMVMVMAMVMAMVMVIVIVRSQGSLFVCQK